MTNNTQVHWSANGLSLHTHAWSVKSFGGRRFFAGAKRGEDIRIAFRRGRIYTPKVRDAQTYDIRMWVLPLNEDGSRDASLTREQKAHENWRRIIEAVDVEGQFPLIKRWYDGTTVKAATAWAELIDGNGPDADDGTGFYFNLEFALSDPYFYVPVASQPIGLGDGLVQVDGEAPTDHVKFTLTSGTNPRITLPDGNWIQYNGTVSTPVVLDVLERDAKRGSEYVNGKVTRNPHFVTWPMLQPGVSEIELSSGAATMIYDAAYR